MDTIKVNTKIIDHVGNEYILLPKDRNGNVIHIGDNVLAEDSTLEVIGIRDDGFIVL